MIVWFDRLGFVKETPITMWRRKDRCSELIHLFLFHVIGISMGKTGIPTVIIDNGSIIQLNASEASLTKLLSIN